MKLHLSGPWIKSEGNWPTMQSRHARSSALCGKLHQLKRKQDQLILFFCNEHILNVVQHVKYKIDAIKVTQINKLAEA